ncbi:MAG: hypothetical protein V1872_01595 [bacterium]
MSKKKQKSDILWKGIIEDLFQDFLIFFMPDIYIDVDFSRGYDFLDKELAILFPESEERQRYIDKLVKVFLKDGTDKWILIHIEIQGYKDEEFPDRMFTYFYRVVDRYKKKIVALALFTDKFKNFKPERYEYDFYQTSLVYKYRTYKIIDQKEEELEKSNNPFTLVILAAKYYIKSLNNEEKRFQFKLCLIRLLLKAGYEKEKIRKIFIFIDILLSLSNKKEELLHEEVKELTGGNSDMGLTAEMSNIGQIAFKKGEREGKREGKREGIIELIRGYLVARFDKIPEDFLEKFKNIKDISKLEKLALQIYKCKNLDEITKLV